MDLSRLVDHAGTVFADGAAFVVREFVAWGAHPAVSGWVAVAVWLAALLPWPLGAVRSWRRAPLFSLSLVMIAVYLLFNRLTIFEGAPISRAALIGNLGFALLGTLTVMPLAWWRAGPREGSYFDRFPEFMARVRARWRRIRGRPD